MWDPRRRISVDGRSALPLSYPIIEVFPVAIVTPITLVIDIIIVIIINITNDKLATGLLHYPVILFTIVTIVNPIIFANFVIISRLTQTNVPFMDPFILYIIVIVIYYIGSPYYYHEDNDVTTVNPVIFIIDKLVTIFNPLI